MNRLYLQTIFIFLLSFQIFIPRLSNCQSRKLSNYVDPFIGTDGFGHTFPGATTPFGMVQLSPDTRIKGWENCSGYHSSNKTIIGFSHTHLSGTGAADYGDIMYMATEGIQLMPGNETEPLSGYRSAFRKETEKAKPGYYKVMLDDHGIQAEMTATTRCGMQKYTFPLSGQSTIILDLVHGIEDKVADAKIEFTGNNSVAGYRRSSGWAKNHVVFFYTEFSMPFTVHGIAGANGKILEGRSHTSPNGLKAYMQFKLRNYESVVVRTGISTVSIDNARANLYAEMQEWDFNKVAAAASMAWDDELSRILVEGGRKEDRTNFYTALYHCMISPNIMSDTDGRYRGMDDKIYKMDRGHMYTVFSLWDTFRALHPLFTIIDPIRAQEFVRALIQKYKESGLLPVWELASNETNCMIGYHSVPVIADAYMKGLTDFDFQTAYEAMKKSAEMTHLGLRFYKEVGYIPSDKENESVSKTLEYTYDDWCIAQIAKAIGRMDEYEHYLRRSGTYLNVYDTRTGFMRGKKNANWVTPFDPYEVSGIYTEANAWQYTWFVPHDIDGMISMMGGMEKFTTRLDSLFSAKVDLTGRSQPDISGMIGQYAHGNEPSHHMTYLYNFTGNRHRTAELTRQIMRNFYTNQRDGLIGNEDCGQMSAWYVFSAMGFYPVCPGNNQYETGSPLFSKITLGKNTGNKFVITADSLSDENIYPVEILLNGEKMYSALSHEAFRLGGSLHFKLRKVPAPVSIAVQNKQPGEYRMVMIPFLNSGEQAFLDSTFVEMKCYTSDAVIRFTNDGSEPDESSMVYKRPFYVKNSVTLKMKAFNRDLHPSYTEQASFIKIPYRKTISYTYPYSHLYTAGGRNGLIDGLRGETGAFGAWQGFYGDDFEAVLDLGEKRQFSKIETSFLQQYPSWIWAPQFVEYFISNDGINYSSVYKSDKQVPLNQPESFVTPYTFLSSAGEARYVKIFARNIKVCPDWHPGAGEKAWLFIDEITVE